MMRRNLNKKYDITQCALYKCSSKPLLAKRLNLNTEDLKHIKSYCELIYSFKTGKKDGGTRIITASEGRLKKIQKRILYLLSSVERPEWVISGQRGKSYIDNGKFHLNSDYFLTIDIRQFYDNCKRDYVYKFFKDALFVPGDIARILTDLVTYKGGVPTGYPTSQMMAYYAYREMFNNINKIAHEHGCIFTLYVDDMTFSSKKPFNHQKLCKEVKNELGKYGHKPKYEKIKYFPKNSHKLITGTVVSRNHELLVSNKLREKIYKGAMQYKSNKETILTPEMEKKLRSLKGQLQAARSVDKSIFPAIHRLLHDA